MEGAAAGFAVFVGWKDGFTMMKIGVLALYALMMVAVIVLTARKKLSLNEFLLGGRNVGPWLSALSYGASYFSAVIIVGYAGSTGWTGGCPPCGAASATRWWEACWPGSCWPAPPAAWAKSWHGHDSRLL